MSTRPCGWCASLPMTPAELRRICDGLNDERGTGGQTELAKRLGWNPSTVRRKLAGTLPITRSDAIAIRAAAEDA
jgi:hypothetical protein